MNNQKWQKGIYLGIGDNYHYCQTLSDNSCSKNKPPCLGFFYRTESGPISFNADESGQSIVEWMLNESWAWDYKAKTIKIFQPNTINPFGYLGSLGIPGKYTNIVTYHFPNQNLINLFNDAEKYYHNKDQPESLTPFIDSIPTTDETKLYDVFDKIIDDCKMIVFWIATFEACVLTKNIDEFKTAIEEKCLKDGIPFHLVNNRDEWPVW